MTTESGMRRVATSRIGLCLRERRTSIGGRRAIDEVREHVNVALARGWPSVLSPGEFAATLGNEYFVLLTRDGGLRGLGRVEVAVIRVHVYGLSGLGFHEAVAALPRMATIVVIVCRLILDASCSVRNGAQSNSKKCVCGSAMRSVGRPGMT